MTVRTIPLGPSADRVRRRVKHRADGKHDQYFHWGVERGDEIVALCGVRRSLPTRYYKRCPPGRNVCPTCVELAMEQAGYGEW